MNTYLALLRGVNVGGKNPVSMGRLKAALEEKGFENVRTYINSGNVIFQSPMEDTQALRRIHQQVILDTFALDIPVGIFSAEELAHALAGAPEWWGDTADTKHNALFVLHPATPAEIMGQVGDCHPEYEKIAACGPVIFWSAPLATFSKVRWIKIVGTPAYQSVTIRNANTARKLLELAFPG